MKEKLSSIIFPSLAGFLFVAALLTLLWIVVSWKGLDARVWRAPSPLSFTIKKKIICDTILQCNLVPGDILVRRYMTSRTQIPASIFKAHYTHASYYVGDGEIVEAFGYDRSNPSQEIRSTLLMNSDWMDVDIEEIVVIRPSYKKDSYRVISEELKSIANDPQYRFGIPSTPIEKKTSCAELIVDALQMADMINLPEDDLIVTPDYLVQSTLTDERFKLMRIGN